MKTPMNKALTTELVQLAEEKEILDLISWGDNFITNIDYVNRQSELGVEVPQEIIDYLNDNTTPILEQPETPLNPGFDPASGLHYFWDAGLQKYLSVQMFSDGQGTNSPRVTKDSYLRRFNGSSMTGDKALGHPYEIVAYEFCCTVSEPAPKAYVDAIYFDQDGNNGRIIGRILFNQANNKFAAAWLNVRILIPAYHRLTARIGGDDVAYPQSYISYRRVVEVNA